VDSLFQDLRGAWRSLRRAPLLSRIRGDQARDDEAIEPATAAMTGDPNSADAPYALAEASSGIATAVKLDPEPADGKQDLKRLKG
jgi:hypothetical protein